jgi:Holliday junction resolvase RusA-like endonuclease
MADVRKGDRETAVSGRCEIEVHDRPRPQQRHRTAGGHEYTPAETKEAQGRIRDAWVAAYPPPAVCGPLMLEVWCYFPRPAGHFGSGRNAGRLRPAAPRVPAGARTDWDNLGKLVADALQGYAYRDDGQIVDGSVHKRYADGRPPGWRIILEEWREP